MCGGFFFHRNEVWRYNRKVWGNPRLRMLKFLFAGLPLGATVAAATIAYEEHFGVYENNHGVGEQYYPENRTHGHGHGHH